jgi:transcriptional regulator with XRE-family HTH domain
MNLYTNIEKLLRDRGVNKRQLANAIDVPYSTIQVALKKHTGLPINVVKKIADHFNVTVDYLLIWDGEDSLFEFEQAIGEELQTLIEAETQAFGRYLCMTIGERLKRFRTTRGLSQKALSGWSGMSEPAIRNYELGNRYPNKEQLAKIAIALDINPLAIADPDLNSHNGLMHTLFQIEDLYGLKPVKLNGSVVLEFDIKPPNLLGNALQSWFDRIEQLRNGEISQEDYDNWRYTYGANSRRRDTEERQ